MTHKRPPYALSPADVRDVSAELVARRAEFVRQYCEVRQ